MILCKELVEIVIKNYCLTNLLQNTRICKILKLKGKKITISLTLNFFDQLY